MVNEDVRKIMENGNLENRTYTMVSKQGKKSTIHVRTLLVKDPNEQPLGMVRVGRENENS